MVRYPFYFYKIRKNNLNKLTKPAQGKKKSKENLEVAFRLEESQRGKHTQGRVVKLKANSLQDKVSWLCDIDSALLEIEKTRKGISLPPPPQQMNFLFKCPICL